MQVRRWLQVFRAQTASATIILILMPYLYGGGELFDWRTILLFVYAVLVHWASFGHNSLMDTANGYDLQDPHKQHHPLVSGEISLERAHNVIDSMLSILTIFGALLPIFVLNQGNPTYALAAFAIYISAGHWYNDGINKTSPFGFIPISLAMLMLGGYAYFLAAKHLTTGAMLLVLYIFLTIWYEISVEGDLKDITVPQRMSMKSLGCYVKDGYLYVSNVAKAYASIIKIASVVVLVLLGFNVFVVPFVVLMLYYHVLIIKNREYDRKRLIRCFSLEEIASIYAVLFAVLNPLYALIIIVVTIAYFVVMNRMLWGTFVAPKV